MTNEKPNLVHRMEFKTGSSHGAARVLHNVQPLSPSHGVLLKALRVGKLAERNAADAEWIGVMVVFNHETEGHQRYRGSSRRPQPTAPSVVSDASASGVAGKVILGALESSL
jgi:hypothetical protein